MFNDYNNDLKESVQREKLGTWLNSSSNKKEAGLTLPFLPPEEREIQVPGPGSPWSPRNNVPSGWVGGRGGRGPSDLTFQVRDLGPFSSSTPSRQECIWFLFLHKWHIMENGVSFLDGLMWQILELPRTLWFRINIHFEHAKDKAMLRASPGLLTLLSCCGGLQKGADRKMATENIPVKIHDPDPGIIATWMELFWVLDLISSFISFCKIVKRMLLLRPDMAVVSKELTWHGLQWSLIPPQLPMFWHWEYKGRKDCPQAVGGEMKMLIRGLKCPRSYDTGT